jgi:cytochrome P450
VFDEPDHLDVGREPNKHLGFGFGVHYCLGAQLARVEGRIAIAELVRRFPDLRLAVPEATLRWRNTVAVRGLEALPVCLQ